MPKRYHVEMHYSASDGVGVNERLGVNTLEQTRTFAHDGTLTTVGIKHTMDIFIQLIQDLEKSKYGLANGEFILKLKKEE